MKLKRVGREVKLKLKRETREVGESGDKLLECSVTKIFHEAQN